MFELPLVVLYGHYKRIVDKYINGIELNSYEKSFLECYYKIFHISYFLKEDEKNKDLHN